VASEVASDPAKIFAILFPTKIVESNSEGRMIMKAIALPFGPPSSINCRARSTPIDNKAASAEEKKAAETKQMISPIIS
jgi:hypothetical protein